MTTAITEVNGQPMGVEAVMNPSQPIMRGRSGAAWADFRPAEERNRDLLSDLVVGR